MSRHRTATAAVFCAFRSWIPKQVSQASLCYREGVFLSCAKEQKVGLPFFGDISFLWSAQEC